MNEGQNIVDQWKRKSRSRKVTKAPENRREARHLIVAVANQFRGRLNPKPYRMRHLQLCVSICRRGEYLDPEVFVIAGFNGSERR